MRNHETLHRHGGGVFVAGFKDDDRRRRFGWPAYASRVGVDRDLERPEPIAVIPPFWLGHAPVAETTGSG
jgi:hypothetical protein